VVQLVLEMPAGTTLGTTSAATSKVEERLLGVPEVESVFTSVGVGGDFFAAGQARFATIYVRLVDKQQRQKSARAIAEQVRAFSSDVPGLTLKSSPQSTFGGGGSGVIQVHIEGEDQQQLASLAARVADIVRKVPGTVDISDGGVVGQPELVVTIDRERAADLGLSAAEVASVLRTGLAGSIVGTFRPEGTKGWDVNVILNPQDRARIDQIADIPVITPRGATIRLSQVAQATSLSGPTQVSRRNRDRSVTVTADVNGRASGDVSKEIQSGLDQLAVPAGYKVSQGGNAEAQNESFMQIFQALGLSVVLMYLLMAVLFESLLFPLIVILSLPLALVGAFGLLALTGNTLNLMSMIGMILLTGLVGKNAILLVDYTNHLRKQGQTRETALLLAGPVRLRPILMTTCALILAMLPLAFKLGEGGEWRSPMAVTVIGGLVTSTLLTLLVVPAVYTIVDDGQTLLAGLPRAIRRISRRGPGTQKRPSLSPVPLAGARE
jgi:hydrophobic/amphiphilic exporter-1 (mainly G- bacteria), HAE1 family